MTTTTIRPASSNQDGWVRAENAVYATAWAAANGSSSSQTNNTTISGQTNSPAYWLYNTLFGPDVSPITSTDTVSAVVFEYTMSAAYSHTSDLRIVGIDHGGGITTADYVDGAAAAALTVWGVIPASNGTSGTTYQISLNSAGIAAVQAAVTAGIPFRFGIVSDDFCNATAPTADHRWNIHSSEAATSANRPALIVTHAAASTDVSVPAGSLTFTGNAPSVLIDAAVSVPAASLALTGNAPSLLIDAAVSVPAGELVLAASAPSILIEGGEEEQESVSGGWLSPEQARSVIRKIRRGRAEKAKRAEELQDAISQARQSEIEGASPEEAIAPVLEIIERDAGIILLPVLADLQDALTQLALIDQQVAMLNTRRMDDAAAILLLTEI